MYWKYLFFSEGYKKKTFLILTSVFILGLPWGKPNWIHLQYDVYGQWHALVPHYTGQRHTWAGGEGETDAHLQPRLFYLKPNTWYSWYTISPKDLFPNLWPQCHQYTFVNLLFTNLTGQEVLYRSWDLQPSRHTEHTHIKSASAMGQVTMAKAVGPHHFCTTLKRFYEFGVIHLDKNI